MLRVIGAFMVAGGAAALGFGAAFRLGKRVDILSGLINAVDVICSELAFSLMGLPELFAVLEKQSPAPINRLFALCLGQLSQLGERSFSDIWKQAVWECLGGELTREQYAAVVELGLILGRYDARGQLEALGQARKRLERLYNGALHERAERGRLYGVLGASAGAAVAIILL